LLFMSLGKQRLEEAKAIKGAGSGEIVV